MIPAHKPSPIEALRNAAKGETFDEAKAVAGIDRSVEAYRRNYEAAELSAGQRFLIEDALKRMAKQKSLKQGKAQLKKLRGDLVKIRKKATTLLKEEYTDTLYFIGGIYEDNKWFTGDDKCGWESAADDLISLLQALDHVDTRLKAVISRRLYNSKKSSNVERLTTDLGAVYRNATGREPASGSLGVDCREHGPFVEFVRSVLRECDPTEAKRKALGHSIYMWLRKDRDMHETLASLDKH